MTNTQDRSRMVFETSEKVKRAIRVRAALDGVKPADVVNAGLRSYLGKELAQVEAGPQDAISGGKRTKGRRTTAACSEQAQPSEGLLR